MVQEKADGLRLLHDAGHLVLVGRASAALHHECAESGERAWPHHVNLYGADGCLAAE